MSERIGLEKKSMVNKFLCAVSACGDASSTIWDLQARKRFAFERRNFLVVGVVVLAG